MRRSSFRLLFTLSVLALALVPLLGSGATTVSANGGDVCISINGNTVVDTQVDGAQCSSTKSDSGRPNIARAYDGGVAVAGVLATDSGNMATATGEFSNAVAGNGDNNTATATGEFSNAYALFGDNNTATATGNSLAYAGFGNNNTATATGVVSEAFAFLGNNNTATATDGGLANAGVGDNNTATASGDCRADAIGDSVTVSCP